MTPLELLLELLARLADPAAIATLTAEELAQLDADITTAATAVAETGDVTDEGLAALEQAATGVQAIRAEKETRQVEADERAQRAEAALALVRGETAEDSDGESETELETSAESETPAETPPVEVEVTVPTAEADAPVEAIAASAPVRRPITRVAARRPAAVAPRANPASGGGSTAGLRAMGLVAGANAPGVTAGLPITDYDQLAAAFMSAYRSISTGGQNKATVVTAGSRAQQYDERFRLGDSLAENTRKVELAKRTAREHRGIRAAGEVAANSRTAAGGICAPAERRYDLPIIKPSTGRPVRDQFMARFGVDRGAISTLPIPVIEDLAGSYGEWTHAVDLAPGAATKSCLDVVCPASLPDSLVAALYSCLKYGNFRARYFPEQIEAWMDLAAGVHARNAEIRLLAAITAGSVGPVTVPSALGTTRDILAGLDRGLAALKYRHRMEDMVTLEWAAPMWLRNQIRTDIARQLPVGSTDETLAVADADMDRWFAVRNIEPVWLRDGETGQSFGIQGAGAMLPYPTTIRTYLAEAGAWLFLDGGELNLGLMRDTTTTATNDVQVFMETFEGSHFHGVVSQVIDFTTGPYGSVSATQDINPNAAVGV